MDDQIILAVGDNGNFNGQYIKKQIAHQGEGQRHLAITVLLFNKNGEVLLQQRKHQVFDDLWDLTGATHPLHKKDGTDETIEEATQRCLEVEYGISEKVKLTNLGFFNYFAKYGDLCENEHCAMLIGEYNGQVNLNSEVGYGYKWMDKEEFLKNIAKNPNSYTPWAIKGAKLLKYE